MSKKEWKICTWIHHIATAAGLCIGMINYKKHTGSAWKSNLLLLYIVSQVWAAVKIAASLFADDAGRTSHKDMQKSYDNIHTLSKNKKEERRWAGVLCALSAVFKIGTPILLG